MAQIFRVERTKNFTVMSNHHFKNKNLTLKAKGLLSLMLSLPDDWNYNMQGLATLSRDGIDSVRSAIKELEHHGYVERHRLRNEYRSDAGTVCFRKRKSMEMGAFLFLPQSVPAPQNHCHRHLGLIMQCGNVAWLVSV